MRRLPRFARSESGASMVEFAIVVPLLVLFASGIIDIGRAFKLYNNLASAARDGARYGAAQKFPNATQIAARVDASFQTMAGDSGPSPNASVDLSDPQQIVVTITDYPYDPLTPLVSAQGLKLTVAASFRWEDPDTP